MEIEKVKLCKKIVFLQEQITRSSSRKYDYEDLLLMPRTNLQNIYNGMLYLKEKELKKIDNENLKEKVIEIFDELCETYNSEKYKCFVFLGEYKNIPIYKLYAYNDEEIWEYMVPLHIEELFGKYNFYIINLVRFILQKLYKDKFKSIQDLLQNNGYFDYYCDINFTLTVNFFVIILKKRRLYLRHEAINMMNKDIIEEFKEYVEKYGLEGVGDGM